KRKDGKPLRDDSPYSDILGVDPSVVKEKVRREPEEGRDLLTSSDLFGDIIDGFRAKQAAPETMAPRPPDFESAGTDPFTPGTPKPLGSGKGYSLLDAAYSTLLKDSHLTKDVERIEKLENAEGLREGSSDYGSYSLLERVATGGMAEVFRAKRKGVEGFEKVVAVKRILPHLSSNKDFVDMFIEEAKMVASLSHPNIVQIFDLGRIDETSYIAMEFVEGKDLRTILTRARNRSTLPAVDLAALIAARVSAALEYAHRHRDSNGQELRIVHRDVSPQNILVSDEGEVKLVDFGIAKAATKASHTDSGSLRGKLLYMSPEQAWGKPLDKRSDLFALGAVFFEILTGHLLFSASSEMSVLERVREARFVPPSSLNPAVPIELEAVVMRLLNKNPLERYQDASEVLLDLDSYLRRRPAVGSGDLSRFVKRLFELDA
ncbi:MAG TPA: serine/threonine-protein kinase, partial [Vicinamibacteria bacterium]